MKKGYAIYSESVPGERSNYRRPVEFDITDGSLGITQKDDPNSTILDRVLLSPRQVDALFEFLRKHRVKKRSRA